MLKGKERKEITIEFTHELPQRSLGRKGKIIGRSFLGVISVSSIAVTAIPHLHNIYTIFPRPIT